MAQVQALPSKNKDHAMKLIFMLSFIFCSCAFATPKIINVESKEEITFSALTDKLTNPSTHFVLGEYHYNTNIQLAQAQFIKEMATRLHAAGNFTVGWEFLNYKDNDQLALLFDLYTNEAITVEILLKTMMGENNLKENLKYAPIFFETKNLNGQFIALNETREVKKYITSGGIENLPPIYMPPHFMPGSEQYFERFKEAMGGHGKPETLKRYFEAQAFTDSAMAYQFEKWAAHPLRFTIVGSFHSDYLDGLVREHKRYSDSFDVVAIKVVDKKTMSKEEWSALLDDRKYGKVADYIIYLE